MISTLDEDRLNLYGENRTLYEPEGLSRWEKFWEYTQKRKHACECASRSWDVVWVGRQLQALTNYVEDIVAEKHSKHNPNNRNYIRDYKKKLGKCVP